MTESGNEVSRFKDYDRQSIDQLLNEYQLTLEIAEPELDIRGSFWGDEEAGLIGSTLIIRADTPLHSLLHEACHFICMDNFRRERLDTNAGGDYDEENAVCYLQILLADEIPAFGRRKMLSDMDAWGYSFRLGSSEAWFHKDAQDARHWLFSTKLIDADDRPTYRLRTAAHQSH